MWSAHAEVTNVCGRKSVPTMPRACCCLRRPAANVLPCHPKWLPAVYLHVVIQMFVCLRQRRSLAVRGRRRRRLVRRRRLLWQCLKEIQYNNRMEFVVLLTGFMALAGSIGEKSIWSTKKSGHCWWEQVAYRKCERELFICESFFFLLRTVIEWTFVSVFYSEVCVCIHFNFCLFTL